MADRLPSGTSRVERGRLPDWVISAVLTVGRLLPIYPNSRPKTSVSLTQYCFRLGWSSLSPLHRPFHQNVRNGETEHVYSRSKVFPFRRAIAPEHVTGVIGT